MSRLWVRTIQRRARRRCRVQLRASAHSDYGSLTILKTEDAPGGLQVQGKAGDWLDVPHLPSCSNAAHPPRYPATTSGGHLREKFVATQQASAD